MNKLFYGALSAVLLAACTAPQERRASAPQLLSGIDASTADATVRAQDDLYRAVNGAWLRTTEIPADKANYGAFTKLADDAELQLRVIIETAANKPGKTLDSDEQKIGDLYASFMNEALAQQLGTQPIAVELARVDRLVRRADIPALMGHYLRAQITQPVGAYVHQDAKDPSKYIVDFVQDGLSLPDRDYYLSSEAKFKDIRAKYLAHIEKMFTLAGLKDGARAAKTILETETALARVQWTRVQSRDAVKTYNPKTLRQLQALSPEFDWAMFLKAAGADGQPFYVVSQPSYISGMARAMQKTKMAAWRTYFKWQVLSNAAPLLNQVLVDENFAFFGTTLSGAKELRPRWKRGVAAVEGALGESVGRIYVAQHFPPEAKTRMDALVKNLLGAYRQGINDLEWMGPQTKQAAQEKLARFTPKIGYPNKWKDYTALVIKPDDLYGNLARSAEVETQRELAKLGGPIDREEWGMTPQTVNAYYNPELNEIVFPAAILQPPFFNLAADDAVNYGGIGAVIGHEISHGFDDQGARYDGDGVLRDWWSASDLKNFEVRSKALIEQYNAYEPLPGQKLNGALTIGENIADLAGLTIAYKAYVLSLKGQPSLVIDGMTGEQRVFMGWAQVWRRKYRDENLLSRIKTDPHSPSEFRSNGVIVNMPDFAQAFGVKPGDKHYKAPGEQIKLW